MKGIILAGGNGTRLAPLTFCQSKQLLPVYDKPMIYYPLSVLILAGIREILIITTPDDSNTFKKLLKDGSQWNLKISYKEQHKPEGIAQAFILGEEFIQKSPVCLILGDNIFYGSGMSNLLQNIARLKKGAHIFAYKVKDPKRYGIVNFNKQKKASHIEEKPLHPKSNFAVTGIYFYDNKVTDHAKKLAPSARGELEITDLNNIYLKKEELTVTPLDRGYAWFDTGTHKSLLDASNFISIVQERQQIQIGSPDEAAWRMGFINNKQLEAIIDPIYKTSYGDYLQEILTQA